VSVEKKEKTKLPGGWWWWECRRVMVSEGDGGGKTSNPFQPKYPWVSEGDGVGDAPTTITLRSWKDTDNKCTLFDVMFHFTYGHSGETLRENTVLTVL
jgi:hypothetical protein